MADDQLTPLQLGQALTLLSSGVRELTTQLIELRTEMRTALRLLSERSELDRGEIREFARDVKVALRESASSESQEMRVARIDTPLPPKPRHGRPRS